MTRYSAQPSDGICAKGCRFLFFFPKNMSKDIGENISKHLSGKYNQRLLDNAKQSATDAYKIA